MTVHATRKGTTARFTDAIWKSGIPQKAGWLALEPSTNQTVLPKEIVDMSEQQKDAIVGVGEIKKKAAAPAAVKNENDVDTKPKNTATPKRKSAAVGNARKPRLPKKLAGDKPAGPAGAKN